LWLLSGSAFPASGAHAWIRIAMALNPITYGVAAVRRALYSGDPHLLPGVPTLRLSLAVTAAFALIMLVTSGWVTRRRTAVMA
jgi:ABC-2 type transport system permease protein